MARIDAFFKLMSEQKASDLHLSTSNPPMLRINGDLIRVDYPPLTNDELQSMVYEIAPEMKIKVFEETGDVDFGYEIPGVARYRANFLNQKYGIAAVFRLIPSKVLTCDDLGLPPVLKRFPLLKKGLVLVTGPTGSGKSTTLAALIDHANLHRQDHIITVEDPIEFVHKSQQSLVNHREVGVHTKSFSAALKGALREDPDIILVGEMRDLETIELALTAAATGHLVFGTLHTSSAAKTVDRVIDVFPTSQQNQVRATLVPPAGLILERAVLQIQHGVSRAGVIIVVGRRVDKTAARGVGAPGRVKDLAELAMRNVLERVGVLVLGRDLDGAAPAAGSEVGLAAGVRDLGAIDVDPIVMKSLIQGARGANPGAVLALLQGDPAPLENLHALGLGRDDAEAGPALGVDLGVLLAALVGGRRLEIVRNRPGLGRRGLRKRDLADQKGQQQDSRRRCSHDVLLGVETEVGPTDTR